MTVATALAIFAALAPYIPEGMEDINSIINRIKGGESLADLQAEFESKRNDLQDLPFGQTGP
jgi:hypothetical protein